MWTHSVHFFHNEIYISINDLLYKINNASSKHMYLIIQPMVSTECPYMHMEVVNDRYQMIIIFGK